MTLSNDKILIDQQIIDIKEMKENLDRKLEAKHIYWIAGFILTLFGLIVNLFVLAPITEIKEDFKFFKSEIKEELKSFKSEIKEELKSFKSEVREDLKEIKEELKIQSQRTDYLYQQNIEMFKEFKALTFELRK